MRALFFQLLVGKIKKKWPLKLLRHAFSLLAFNMMCHIINYIGETHRMHFTATWNIKHGTFFTHNAKILWCVKPVEVTIQQILLTPLPQISSMFLADSSDITRGDHT